jgi:hypothetical protein
MYEVAVSLHFVSEGQVVQLPIFIVDEFGG